LIYAPLLKREGAGLSSKAAPGSFLGA
jgi:hypothetical protein